MSHPESKTISALHEILEWSKNCPDWQKDALRRLATVGTLGEDDIGELTRLCRAKHLADWSNATAVSSRPLMEVHLPPNPCSDSSVTLVTIGFVDIECDEIQRLVKKCHDVTEAHDSAACKQTCAPEPAELEKDIIDTKAVLESIRKRKRALA
jgi:hypothetical protein